MEFIATVNRGGYRPTGREINEWRLQAEPKPARKGKLLEEEIPDVPSRRVRKGPSPFDSLAAGILKSQHLWRDTLTKQILPAAWPGLTGLNASAMRGIMNATRAADLALGYEYEVIPGRPGRPAVYGPDKSPEKFLAHLRRLNWIERDSRGRYAVTLLGHALLKAEASAESGDGDSPVMVLAAEDENLGYGQVLGVIADCGDALIVDGYLDSQALIHILAHTNASRFLIGDRMNKGRVTELAVHISLAPPNDDGAVRELRRASFHDRYLIGDHRVYGLTASLNGVSKSSMAILLEMPDIAARAIRAQMDELWVKGEVVAQGLRPHEAADDLVDDQDRDDDAATREAKAIRHEDGAYLHDGCTVRHRSEAAAGRCKSGS